MTTTAKGTARKRSAARTKKVERNKQRVEEVKRDETTGAKPTARKGGAKAPAKKMVRKVPAKKAAAPAPKKAVAKKPTKDDGGEPLWEGGATLGSNTDRLKTAGVTWKRIAEMANESGEHEVPWPDGGRLLRARKQFLAGTEGKPKAERRVGKRRRTTDEEDERSYQEQAKERLEAALADRKVPWEEQEMTDEQILEFLNGRRFTYVSSVSGFEKSDRSVKNSKHNKMGMGANGPYYDYVSQDGPFMTISLSRIVSTS